MIAFDTHAFIKCLIGAGMPAEQAEALAKEQTKLIDNRLSTKDDLHQLGLSLRTEMTVIDVNLRAEMKVMKWMSGLIVAGVVTLILKAFF